MHLDETTKLDTHSAGDRILRLVEATAYLGLSVSTLAKRRMRGEPPRFVKLTNKLVGYRLSDCEAYLVARRRVSTSDRGEAAR